jgi:hypothetical protein
MFGWLLGQTYRWMGVVFVFQFFWKKFHRKTEKQKRIKWQ